jgi:hypothetical protein
MFDSLAMSVILSSGWTVALIVLVCIGLLWGSIDMAKAVFRRQAQIMERQRKAIDFALLHFGALKDASQEKDLLTQDSLRLAKYRFGEENRGLVEILYDKLPVWGHVIREIGVGTSKSYVFGASRDDLTRARQLLH